MNHDLTMGHEDQMAIVLGQRQLMAVCCMFLVVLGLVSTLSYVAGRSITAAQFRSMERAEVSAPAPAPIVVAPSRRQAQAAAAAPPEPVAAEALEEEVEPAAKPSPFGDSVAAAATAGRMEFQRPAKPHDPGPLSEPARGTVFFQVGSIERSMSTVLGDYLTEQGYRVRLAPGVSPALVRVLVGPLSGEQEIQKTDAALGAAGFDHFLRKY